MFRSLSQKFAKIALSVMTFQLLLFGLVSGPNGAYAMVSPDNVSPIINSISFAGQTAIQVGNIFTADVSESTDFSAGNIAVSEDSELYVVGLADPISLVAGMNNITVSDIVGSTVTIDDLRNVSTGGVLTINATLVDFSDNATSYTLVLGTADIINPELSNVSFGSKNAINAENIWKFDVAGMNDGVLSGLKVGFTTTEDSTLYFSTYGTSQDLLKGYNEYLLSDLVGSTVTNELLNSIAVDGKVVIDSILSDTSLNYTAYQFVFSLDTTAPVVKVSTKPVIVSDVTKSFEVLFSANEPIELSKVTLSQNNGGFDDVILDSLVATKIDDKNYKLVIDGNQFKAGLKPIVITAFAKDVALNKTDINFDIKVDTVAPIAITGLKAIVAESGAVTLTWTNPVDNTDVDYIEVRRDGVFVSTLPATTNSFVDSSTEKGKTYYYEIVLVDKAGNKTVTPRLDVVIPAPVLAAAVSDSTTSSQDSDKAEVKAETSEDKTNEENKEEEKSGFPVWGILLLLVLLAVGGYLYWSQKPATIASVAPKAVPAKKSKPKAKKK